MADGVVNKDRMFILGTWLPVQVGSRSRFVSFSRLCESLELCPEEEWARLEAMDFDRFAWKEVDHERGGEVCVIAANAIPLWLFNIPSKRIPRHLREAHNSYASDLIDAIATPG